MLKKIYQIVFALCALASVSQSAVAMVNCEGELRRFSETNYSFYFEQKGKKYSVGVEYPGNQDCFNVEFTASNGESWTLNPPMLKISKENKDNNKLKKLKSIAVEAGADGEPKKVAIGFYCESDSMPGICGTVMEYAISKDSHMTCRKGPYEDKFKEDIYTLETQDASTKWLEFAPEHLKYTENGLRFAENESEYAKRYDSSGNPVSLKSKSESKKDTKILSSKTSSMGYWYLGGFSLLAVTGLVCTYVWNKKKEADKKAEDSEQVESVVM